MSMRKKEILPEEGARVYQKQGLSKGQKIKIAAIIVLFIMIITGGLFAYKLKLEREEAEIIANAPEQPTYINQLSPIFKNMYGYKFSATIDGLPYKEFLPEACGVLTANYNKFYIEGYVDVNEVGYTLTGIDEQGNMAPLTSFIFNSNGGYMDVSNYYSYYPDIADLDNLESQFYDKMQGAKYISIPNSAFTDRDYFTDFIVSIFAKAKESADTEYAVDVTKENSYSLRFSPSVFTDYPDVTISKMFMQSSDMILSSVEYSGEPGYYEISAAFQQGDNILNIDIKECKDKKDDSLIYSVSKETLDSTMSFLITEHDKAVKEQKKEEAEAEAAEEKTEE